ncbi:ATP-binding cassette domain-containing protein [Actinomycetospora termitidis]|uniref:ATP-binding cassette domain-containing protein n=1 Tax=Actinomycetospora termitidis TaxID=3053470 RepID=A0ABT7MD36_9PSEU|nr:ATP-binding cassette domain-containing protein [Actinomycetospora sp. Odt1-22]MDL5158586.1 ATP-binding cassette domain-containing protein [Actinomycetospora sp. Odt1-22]
MDDNAIEAEGLVKQFRGNVGLAGIDLRVPAGSVLALLGPNGAGKTTAVRILGTLLRPDAGHARVGGLDVVARAHEVRGLIGLTGQYAGVDETLTGTENLVLVGRLLGLARRAARARAAELLAEFGLVDAATRPAATYSGGMRRRLDLAASLVGRPRVLFLDEPTTGLDPASRVELWAAVRGLVDGGTTVLLTTQYLEEADRLADDVVVLDRGRVVAAGTPDGLKASLGGSALELRPVLADRLDVVATTARDLARGEVTVVDGAVRATVSDPDVLPAVLRRLDEAGVHLAEVSLRRASLDEVFLSLVDTPSRVDPTPRTATRTGSPA